MDQNDYIDSFVISLENSMKEYSDINILITKKSNTDDLKDIFRKMKDINDLSMSLILANADLAIALKYIVNAKNRYEQLYFLKNVFLTIHETLVAYESNGKLIYEGCIGDYEAEKKLKALSENLKRFKKDFNYEKYIIPIRNNISAHINVDFFYNENEEIDADKTIAMTMFFGKEFLSNAVAIIRGIITNTLKKSPD